MEIHIDIYIDIDMYVICMSTVWQVVQENTVHALAQTKGAHVSGHA